MGTLHKQKGAHCRDATPFQNTTKQIHYTGDLAQLKLGEVTTCFPYYLLNDKPKLRQTLLAMVRGI